MMTAQPTYCHSHGSPQTYRLRDGRIVEVRQGCLIEQESRRFLAGSESATVFLLCHGALTDEERAWLKDNGEFNFPVCGNQQMSIREHKGNQV